MWERDRANVAVTRATEVLWVIGGEMRSQLKSEYLPLITQYKRQMEANGQVHQTTKPRVGFVAKRVPGPSDRSAPSL